MLKKIIFVTLAFVLLLGSLYIPTGAIAIVETISASNVISGGQGVGFYDTSESGTLEGSSVITLREGEWLKYNLANFEKGAYELKINAANIEKANITIKLNDAFHETAVLNPTASFSDNTETKLCNIFLSNEIKTLTIENNDKAVINITKYILIKKDTTNTVGFEAENIIPGGQGEAFFDNATGENVTHKIEVGTFSNAGVTAVCLRKSEWVKIDVSSLDVGTYIFSSKASNTSDTRLSVFVDDMLQINSATVAKTSAYDDFKEQNLNVVYIKEDTETIKVKNTGKGAAMYLDGFNLKFLSNERLFSENVKVNGADIISIVEGEGYHDEAGLAATDARVIINDDIILHSGDWGMYDISCLPFGTYDVKMCFANKANTTIDLIADGIRQKTAAVASTGSYGTYKEVDYGKFYVSDDSSLLKIENSGGGAVYFKYIIFEYISENISDMYNTEFYADCVIPGGQGVGYYDNLNITPNSEGQIEYLGGAVILRTEEWLKYSAKNMPTGEYKVYLETAQKSNATVSLCVNDTNVLTNTLKSTGAYGSFETNYVGNITFAENDTITLLNSGDTSCNVKNIRFEIIPFYENITYTADALGEEKIKSFGGKSTIYLSGSFQNSYYPCGSFELIYAFYDGDKCLIYVDSFKETVDIGETRNIAHAISVPSGAISLKTFILNSVKSISPLAAEKKIFDGIVTELYVDASLGNDANTGYSAEKALKTIEEAKKRVRNINNNMHGDIVVHLNGEFKPEETLLFNAVDSGTNGYEVIYDGDNNASVSGGTKIEGFTSIEGTPLYSAEVSLADFRHLYVNGNRAQRARSKWLYWAKAEYEDPNGEDTLIGTIDGFILNGDDFDGEFSKPLDMEFVWMPSWKNVRMPVKTWVLNSDSDYVVTFEQPYFDSALSSSESQPAPKVSIPYYIENAPEFLDEPGEWYYDKDAGKVYYYPRTGEDMQSAEVYVPELEILLNLEGSDAQKIKNITFSGIEFKYGAWNRTQDKGFTTIQAEWMPTPELAESGAEEYPYSLVPAQVQVNYGENISFTDNRFVHMGSVALSYNNKTDGGNISGNVFDDTSASAITISSPEGFVKTTPLEDFCRNINVENNLIRRVSVEYLTPAVTAYYVNNVNISHNDILDTPYTGISLGWGWGRGVYNCQNNTVSSNRIENVLYKLKDGGHIYTLDTLLGTVIENNYLIKAGEWKGGIYLDNASEGLTIRNNVFEDCERWLKLTYHNVKNNTACDNYSETGFVVDYPDINNIAQATGKTDGEWDTNAQAIIENAGLTAEYKHLLTEYNQQANLVNDQLGRMPYIKKPGIIIPLGNVMPGGEGDAYHDTVPAGDRIGIIEAYDGTGHKYLMNTAQGEWTKYEVEIPETGDYRLIVNAASKSDTNKISIWIDDVCVVDSGSVQNTGNYDLSSFADNDYGFVHITNGNHIIKIEQTIGNCGLYSLRLTQQANDDYSRNDGFVSSILEGMGR